MTRDLQRSFRIREEGLYIIGIYLIRKISVNDLIDKITRNTLMTVEDAKKKIMSHFKDSDEISL